MKQAERCVVCGGEIRRRARGLAAPFLARRIWGRSAFAVELTECGTCGFIFYNPRMEPGEEARLYAGYRGEEYQRMRYACEPWYTRRFNDSLFSPAYVDIRRQKLSEMLREHLEPGSVRKLLDFGGSDGDLVRGLIPGAQAYVYDISGVAPVDGVRSCADLEECRQHDFDLTISSNVLEHVGFPRDTLAQINSAAGPGTLAFVEVPFETPFSRDSLLKRAVQEAVLLLARPRIGWQMLKPGVLYWMHEHVNFFRPESLRRLMTSTGWTVVDSGVYEVATSPGKASMVWCLAQRNELQRPEAA